MVRCAPHPTIASNKPTILFKEKPSSTLKHAWNHSFAHCSTFNLLFLIAQPQNVQLCFGSPNLSFISTNFPRIMSLGVNRRSQPAYIACVFEVHSEVSPWSILLCLPLFVWLTTYDTGLGRFDFDRSIRIQIGELRNQLRRYWRQHTIRTWTAHHSLRRPRRRVEHW